MNIQEIFVQSYEPIVECKFRVFGVVFPPFHEHFQHDAGDSGLFDIIGLIDEVLEYLFWLFPGSEEHNIVQFPNILVILDKWLLQGLEILIPVKLFGIEESINNRYFFNLNRWVIFFEEVVLAIPQKDRHGLVKLILEVVFDELEVIWTEVKSLLYLGYLQVKFNFLFFVWVVVQKVYREVLSIDEFVFQLFVSSDRDLDVFENVETHLQTTGLGVEGTLLLYLV